MLIAPLSKPDNSPSLLKECRRAGSESGLVPSWVFSAPNAGADGTLGDKPVRQHEAITGVGVKECKLPHLTEAMCCFNCLVIRKAGDCATGALS